MQNVCPTAKPQPSTQLSLVKFTQSCGDFWHFCYAAHERICTLPYLRHDLERENMWISHQIALSTPERGLEQRIQRYFISLFFYLPFQDTLFNVARRYEPLAPILDTLHRFELEGRNFTREFLEFFNRKECRACTTDYSVAWIHRNWLQGEFRRNIGIFFNALMTVLIQNLDFSSLIELLSRIAPPCRVELFTYFKIESSYMLRAGQFLRGDGVAQKVIYILTRCCASCRDPSAKQLNQLVRLSDLLTEYVSRDSIEKLLLCGWPQPRSLVPSQGILLWQIGDYWIQKENQKALKTFVIYILHNTPASIHEYALVNIASTTHEAPFADLSLTPQEILSMWDLACLHDHIRILSPPQQSLLLFIVAPLIDHYDSQCKRVDRVCFLIKHIATLRNVSKLWGVLEWLLTQRPLGREIFPRNSLTCQSEWTLLFQEMTDNWSRRQEYNSICDLVRQCTKIGLSSPKQNWLIDAAKMIWRKVLLITHDHREDIRIFAECCPECVGPPPHRDEGLVSSIAHQFIDLKSFATAFHLVDVIAWPQAAKNIIISGLERHIGQMRRQAPTWREWFTCLYWQFFHNGWRSFFNRVRPLLK